MPTNPLCPPVSLSGILDRNILPLAAAHPPVALLFKNVHRLADPRSAGPDTLAADRPPDCRLAHPDTCRRQRVPRSGQRGTDPLEAPRREQRGDLHTREFRPGFREPGEQGKPGPVPCHLTIVRSAQPSSPALPQPHHTVNSALPKSERQIYWLSTTSGIVLRTTGRDSDPHHGRYVERCLPAASSATKTAGVHTMRALPRHDRSRRLPALVTEPAAVPGG